jgi:segregation and condensation protein A
MTDAPPTGPVADTAGEKNDTPRLVLDGFEGPLERLLALARAERIDLAGLPLQALLDQLIAALGRAAPLARKADWLVMAAWLLLLRSRLSLPPDAPGQPDAARAAEDLRARLIDLGEIRALAAWLDRRPQPGRDFFCRGQPEGVAVSPAPAPEIDVIEFLWAAMALFDDDPPAIGTAARPPPPTLDPPWLDPPWLDPRFLALHSIADARARIARLLAAAPEGCKLAALLPDAAGTEPKIPSERRLRSAWSSIFIASLELARDGAVVLSQDGFAAPIHVAATTYSR